MYRYDLIKVKIISKRLFGIDWFLDDRLIENEKGLLFDIIF